MTNIIELFPQPLEITNKQQKRSCLLKETLDGYKFHEKELWFYFPEDIPMPEDSNCDSYLIATLLYAMKSKADLIIHGSVSQELLSNLTEFQFIWNKWYPQIYNLTNIKVEHISKNEARLHGAVVAFSSGVDAQFTTYRHAMKMAGYRTQAILAGVFVHGFDIDIEDNQGFLGASVKASETLSDLGLSLLVAKTNIRKLFPVNWEHQCGTAIASVLCAFCNYAGTGLIGSSDSYDRLPPWGSHPLSDPLLSSENFRIIHDGSGFTRIEKIKTIMSWQLGVRNLRVCWQGHQADRNCGKCEKCIRTRMNFLVAGLENPSCFDTQMNRKQLRNIYPSNGIRVEWEKIRNEMIKTQNGIEWLPEVENFLNRKNPLPKFTFIFPIGSKRRSFIKKIVYGK